MNKLLTILCLFLAFACNTKKAQETDVKLDILGRWTLESIKLSPQDEIIIPTKDYWIEMTDGNFSFNKEKNMCRGKFEWTGTDKINIQSPLGCTKICCDKDISDELTYETVTQYKLSKNRLTLIAPDRKFELIKIEKAVK